MRPAGGHDPDMMNFAQSIDVFRIYAEMVTSDQRVTPASDEHYLGICQSRNRGHQNAVLAGLMEAKDHCDITISIDCDGQDDINAMDAMVDEYLKGAEVVYGVRSKRDKDSFFKRSTAEGFYKLAVHMLVGKVAFDGRHTEEVLGGQWLPVCGEKTDVAVLYEQGIAACFHCLDETNNWKPIEAPPLPHSRALLAYP